MPTFNISIKAIPESLYNSTNDYLITDSKIIIALWSLTSGTKSLVAEANVNLNQFTHIAQLNFSPSWYSFPHTEKYYIQVRHPNAIALWSNTSIPFTAYSSTGSYNIQHDFSSSASSTLGDNVVQINSSPVRFGMYSGDLNNDGIIDASDSSILENNIDTYEITP